jgi:hypothetical protein
MSHKKDERSISVTGPVGVNIIGNKNKVKDIHASVGSNAPPDQLGEAFAAILQEIDRMPDGPDKGVARSAADALYAEAQKGDNADEGAARRYLNFLLETAPDAWEVAIDTLINPIKGVSTVIQKVASRAKAERGA